MRKIYSANMCRSKWNWFNSRPWQCLLERSFYVTCG